MQIVSIISETLTSEEVAEAFLEFDCMFVEFPIDFLGSFGPLLSEFLDCLLALRSQKQYDRHKLVIVEAINGTRGDVQHTMLSL